MVETELQRDRKKYVVAQRLVRKTVRAAKDTWFLCEDAFRCRLVELVEEVWKESSVHVTGGMLS